MFERDDVFIGNRWVKPSGTDRIEVVSPSTEEVVGRVPASTAEDVDRAVAAARKAFTDGPWPRMSLAERSDALRRLVQEFDKVADEAVELQIDEMGGTRQFVNGVTRFWAAFLERYIQDTELVQFREVRAGTAGEVLVLREPIGVTAGVTPWNAPLMTMATKFIPSLLMGCPMVLKPAPEAPLSCYALADAVIAAGLPEGTLSFLNGGIDVGQALVGHAGIDMATFTGSPGGGAAVASLCGSQVKPAQLELGGKSAAIILDGDIDSYLPSLIGNSLRNVGQICISTNRVLVNEDQHDELVERLVDRVASMKVGDPHDDDTDFGPLVASRQRDRVEHFIAAGQAEGAKVVLGGGRPPGFDKGWYVEPTIFVNVENSMSIAQEEIFGPVLSVIKYRDEDEAVAIANDSVYGLGGAVFSSDVERAVSVASRIETGTCAINDAMPSGGGGPFGGYKRSGLGRERSREGLEAFLEIKSVSLPPGYSLDAAS
ncbi:MAG: aldehyde dehydrogenase [Actinomycetia bacterium]|nr:aldehyde dehydrogenase [Actinomycetes bacterium]